MGARLLRCLVALLLGLDMMVETLILSPVYVLTGRAKPNGRLSISGMIGWAAAKGYWWGRLIAPVIDAIMMNRQHCAEAAKADAAFEAGL